MNIFDDIPIVEITEEIVKNLKNDDEFSVITVELAKEIGMISGVIVCMRETENDVLDKRKAIIYGLGIQLNKIYAALLDSYCQKRREITMIFCRCFLDIYIEIINFSNFNEEESYLNFMKNSLKSDYKLYEEIEENIRNRGSEIEIEKRMKQSILNCFSSSNLTFKEVKSYKPKSILDKFKINNREHFYQSMYRMCSHSIHPNWTNILFNNLEKIDNEGFVISTEYKEPDIRILAPIIMCLCDALLAFQKILFSEDVIRICEKRINDIWEHAILLNKYHEQYIQKCIEEYNNKS